MIRKTVAAALWMLSAATFASAQSPETQEEHAYGSNTIRIAPITAMDAGVGFGLSYERILGKDQMIGLVLPVSMILENKQHNDLGSMYNTARYNTYVYFTPGLKIYPMGQRRVTYAVGPSLLLAWGGGNQWQYRSDLTGTYLEDVKMTRLRLGMLVTNYVNFQISRSFNLGLEGALGVRYYDRTSYSGPASYAGNGEFSNGFDITGQFSLSFGYRF